MTKTLPEQKLPQIKKTKEWYKQNIEASCYLTRSDSSYLNTWRNQIENYNLSLGILDTRSLDKWVDPSNFGQAAYPVQVRHIGIGNAKLNILLGDYLARKWQFRASISNKDQDGVSSMEEDLKKQLFAKLNEVITTSLQTGEISEEYYKAKLEEIQKWMTYDYQDIRELVINQLLNYYYANDDFLLKFTEGFKNFITLGKVAYWIDDFGGKPEIRKLNPLCVTTIGGNTQYIHEKDIIIVEEYKSVGQIYDDYWDELKDEDRKKIEEMNSMANVGNNLTVLNTSKVYDSQNIFEVIPADIYDQEHYSESIKYNDLGLGTVFDKTLRTQANELLVTTVFWKTRRKIGKLTYPDPNTGIEIMDWVAEGYTPDKFKGEAVKWLWINEWCRGTKIGIDVFVECGPVKSSGKSMTNLSSGLPPIIGLEVDRSIYDTIKHLDKSYDVVYWKRDCLLATYKGKVAGVNAAMIPSGADMDIKTWLHMASIDGILLLDPTSEIQKGSAQGKIAGNISNWVTQDISLGDNNEGINTMTQHLQTLEYTMGSICGIPESRMGEVGERQAVRNTQFEMAQFQKATEMQFKLEENVRRICIKKFVEVIKLFHRDNPMAGSYFLNDLSREFLQSCDEIAECEYDIQVSNSNEDTKLMARFEQALDNGIAQGNVDVSMILATTSNSISKIKNEFREREKEKAEREQKLQQQAEASQKELMMLQIQEKDKQRAHDATMKEADINIKKYDIDQRTYVALNAQENNVEEPELIDDNNTDLVDLALRERDINEKIRHNKTKEKLEAEKNSIARIQKKKAPSTK